MAVTVVPEEIEVPDTTAPTSTQVVRSVPMEPVSAIPVESLRLEAENV